MKILDKKVIAQSQDTRITYMQVLAPDIAKEVKPGQFVVLVVNEVGERIPLTVVDKDKNKGIITLIFQEVGLTTKLLGKLNGGDLLYALAGPLGHPTEIKNYGKVILVGGGVGIAEIYPVAKALKEEGNYVTTILGARTKSLLILEEELRKSSDELHICTDDGSYGERAFTTSILKDLLTHDAIRKTQYALVYAVGPIPMMKRVAGITREFNIKTIVSLNALMVDATGMCGCCRITVGGEVKFSCIDGPEFDAHSVDWQELEQRNRIYLDKEQHICKLYKI